MSIPSDWRVASFGEVLTPHYGRALPAAERSVDALFPLVGSAGRMATRTSSALVVGPALIIGRKGNVGHISLEPDGCWPLDTTYYVEPPTDVFDQRFLMHQLVALDLRSLDSSTALPSLRRQDLERQQLVVPPLPEQRRIVNILEDHLSRLDAAADYMAAAAHRSRTLAAARLSGLVSPSDPVVALGALAHSSGYGTSTKCSPGGPGPAVVRIPNLRDGAVDLEDEKRAVDPTVELSHLMLTPGDLLVVRTNGSRDLIGRTAIVQPGVEASFASYLIRYQLDRARVLPEWVHLMLGRPQARRTLEDLAASSAGQYNLSLGKLDTVPIPLPPLAEQSLRVEAYEEARVASDSLPRALSYAQRRSIGLRRALLAAAFSGRLTGRASETDLAEGMSEQVPVS